MFDTFALLLILIATGAFWLETLKVREEAIRITRELCKAHHLQLLDETVSLTYLSVLPVSPPKALSSWSARWRTLTGRLAHIGMRRVYEFEFSEAGNDRGRGTITMRGRSVEAIYLPPDIKDPSSDRSSGRPPIHLDA